MVNEFPTFPGVLAEASASSLNDLAVMNPEEMSPADELAYIGHLREMRVRYERALGAPRAPKARGKAASAKDPKGLLSVDLGASNEGDGDQGDLF